MEIIQNPDSGLFRVELGGVLWNNCTVDADCPGRALCSINASWSEYPNMCACLFSYDYTGANCETVGSFGMAYFVINVISSVLTFVWLVIGLRNLHRMIQLRQLTRNALSFTLVMSILGLVFTFLQTTSINRFGFQIVPVDDNGMRRDRLRLGTVFLALSFCFTTISSLNVSVIWAEIATNVERVRLNTAATSGRNAYRKVLIVYYFIIFGAMVVSLALGQVYGLFLSLSVAAVVAIPGTVFIVVSYCIATMKMRRMLKLYIEASGSLRTTSISGPGYSPEMIKSVRESIQSIQIASLGVGVTAFMFVCSNIWWVGLGGIVDHPTKQINLIPMALSWFWVAVINCFVMQYLSDTIRRRERALVHHDAGGSFSTKKVDNQMVAVAIDCPALDLPPEGQAKNPSIRDLIEVESFSSKIVK